MSTRPRLRTAVPLLTCAAVLAAPHLDAQSRRQKWQERQERRKAEAAANEQTGLVRRITTIKQGGGRVDWVDGKIAFDMMTPGGVFAVYVMRPDGSGERCLTCGHPDLPKRNIGQPAWDSSGRYVVMQVEKAVHRRTRFSHVLTPDSDVLNDL